MVRNHLKRIAAPKTWTILRKVNMFTTRPNSGAHSLQLGLSLNTFLKEIVAVAQTTKEVKKIIHDKQVIVDGRVRYDEKFVIGFMDVVSIPAIGKHYRIILTQRGKLAGVEISEAETKTKVAQIRGKTTMKGGKTQINLSGGRIIIIDKDQYAVGDSLHISVPEQKVIAHLPLKQGASVIIMSGKHSGDHGVIEQMDEESVTIKNNNGQIITKRSNIFVTGDAKPVVTCSQ